MYIAMQTILLLALPLPVHATYIDVGSGSYLVQLIIAWVALLFVGSRRASLKRAMQWLRSRVNIRRHE